MRRLRYALGRMLRLVLVALYRDSSPLPLERFGTPYGGWWCCSRLLGSGQTALCAGAGEDVSFDVALNARLGMRVLCVDPTPRAVAHVAAMVEAAVVGRTFAIESGPERYDFAGFDPGRFEAVPCALWREDGTLRLYAPQDPAHVSHSALNLQRTSEFIEVPARRVITLLRERDLESISLFKLDIEGAEYEVLDDLLASGVRPTQVLVEFDELHSPLSPLAILRVGRRIRALRRVGYALVEAESCNFVFLRRDVAPGRS